MKFSSFRHRLNSGFSLIELLVIMAVILLLLRLLLPSLEKARETAYKVQCTNNLHQLGVAFLAYVTDNSKFPMSGDGGGVGADDWMRTGTAPQNCMPRNYATGEGCALGHYANPSGKPCAESVFWCPIYANDCAGPFMYSSSIRSKPVSSLWNPAGVYLLVEEKEHYEADGVTTVQTTNCGGPNTGNSNCGDHNLTCGCGRAESASGRHLNGSNALFADGHVKWGKKERLSGDTQDQFGCWEDGNEPNSHDEKWASIY